MKFDLVVLGGGPAGYTGAIRAAKLGMSVALVEKDSVGGTCLNRGCIPTKALLHSSNLFRSKEEWEKIGIIANDVTVDQEKIYAHKEEITKTLRDGILALLKGGKIAVYSGEGKLTSKNTLDVNGEEIEFDKLLIATGSSPAALPIKGIENALNSDDVLAKPIESEEIVIIGGGVIGMEFASYLSGIGKKVTVVEAMERILPMMSKEISIQLSSVVKKNGVSLMTGAKVVEIGKDFVKVSKNDVETDIPCGVAIVAIGRKANIKGIGLEEVGVETNGRFITVNDDMQTTVENIYAVGDAIGKVQLAHFAAASAIVAVERMCGKPASIDLSVVPSCVYTSPEVAVCGKVDFEGAKQGKFLLGANGKSLINGSNRGFIKIVCDENDVVKGAEMF
ncbi:MAG: FAD-dependent oxidoreductase, partial [Clostridia bacterium]|nr:FAD-dependent oxidoreductase [Clostridia bacterium]